MAQRLVAILTAALFGATLVGCNKKDPEPAPRPPPPLTQQGLASSSWKSSTPDLHDRLLLAHAIALGKTEAVVMVATSIGSTPMVAAEIAKRGGEIQDRFDDAGFLYARLPIERLPEVSALPEVLMAHLDGGAPGGLYALDRAAFTAGSMWKSRAGRAHRPEGYLALTNTLLGVMQESSPEPRSELVREALESTRSSVPLSLGIHHLLQSSASPMDDGPLELRGEGRFPAGGQDLYALMANRAVELYGKPMFAHVGNGGRVDGVSGSAAGRRVLAIGELDTDGRVAAWSSRGPASDGGAKPDLLFAPAGASSAAGAAAMAGEDFAKAARAELLPADARHLTWALRMSARRLEDYQPHEQGFGVMDVARATELLRQVKAQKFELPDILTRAPVKTYLSRFLPEPGVGQGLYEREGWLVKRPGKRTITLVRQNGAPTPLVYSLQWQGNNGAFKALQDEVILPFDTPVDVEIEITPAEAGIHSALLYLIDKTTALPVHAVMATVVASEQFTAANGYTIQHRKLETTERTPTRHFLEVPPNVSSLRVAVAAGSGQVDMLLGAGGALGAGFNVPRASKPIDAGRSRVIVVPYAPPGVYELTLIPVGRTATVDVTASIHYVDSQLDEAPPQNNSTTLWLNNIYAPLQRTSIVAEAGARRVLDDVGGQMGMRTYNINVPADSSTLRVGASPADGRARMGLYLYDCTTGACALWGADVFTKTTEKLLIAPTPRAGLWRVVVDASAEGTAFKYSELITNPRFGAGTGEGADEPRSIGARWNQKVSFKAAGPAPFGYDAVAVMDLIDSASEAEEHAPSGAVRSRPERPLPLTTQVFKLTP